jgi:DegV family protein with EDD domain
MKVKITAESIVDLSKDLLEEYNLSTMPLIVTLGGEEFFDGVSIVPDDIYAFVEKTKTLPKTAARSPEDYETFFNGFLNDGYDAVVHLSISEKMSMSYQNACKAAANMKNVFVIDSKSLSSGTGIQAMYAAQLAKEGKGPREIVEAVEARREKAYCSFITDNLNYLHKGGRCSGTQKFMATMLRIKPTIEMQKDGSLTAGKKFMGSLKGVISKYTRYMLEDKKIDISRVFITHTETDKEIVDKVRAIVSEMLPGANITETMAGATITCHCGKGTLGVLFYTE